MPCSRFGGWRRHPVLAVVIGVVLLAGSAGLAMRDQRDERVGIDRALTSKVSDEAGQLEEYFARARTINLITAHNPAFGDFYPAPGSRLALQSVRLAAVHLGRLWRLRSHQPARRPPVPL